MPFSAQRAGLLRGRCSRTGCGSSRRRVRHVQAPRAPQLLVLICLPANRRICNLSGIQMPSGNKILGGFAGENPPQPRTLSYEGSPGRTRLNPGHTLRCGHLASLNWSSTTTHTQHKILARRWCSTLAYEQSEKDYANYTHASQHELLTWWWRSCCQSSLCITTVLEIPVGCDSVILIFHRVFIASILHDLDDGQQRALS